MKLPQSLPLNRAPEPCDSGLSARTGKLLRREFRQVGRACTARIVTAQKRVPGRNRDDTRRAASGASFRAAARAELRRQAHEVLREAVRFVRAGREAERRRRLWRVG